MKAILFNFNIANNSYHADNVILIVTVILTNK